MNKYYSETDFADIIKSIEFNVRVILLKCFVGFLSKRLCFQTSAVSADTSCTGTYGPGSASLSGCIWLHLILYSIHRTATYRRRAMSHSNTLSVRNHAPLTARSSSSRYVSAAKYHTVGQYFKTCRTKPRKHPSRSDLSWNTRHDFQKILTPWEHALETKRGCFSKVSLESNVTSNITKSSDSFSKVPPIVNRDYWGCIECDLETIIFLVFLAFNFISQRSHHSLTLPRSRISDSTTCNSNGWITSGCITLYAMCIDFYH